METTDQVLAPSVLIAIKGAILSPPTATQTAVDPLPVQLTPENDP